MSSTPTFNTNIPILDVKPKTKLPTYPQPKFGTISEGKEYGFIPIRTRGTYEEWRETVISALVQRYLKGDQSMLDSLSGATGPLGQPNRADFGSATGGKNGQESVETYRFFERYVDMYGASDPWLREMFGSPPSEHAEWVRPWLTSDESIALQQQEYETRLAVAQIESATTLQATAMRVGADLQIAAMENATRRYIAEGEWGVQRQLAKMQEAGTMARFLMDLGFRYDELVVRAQAERNRHHEAMLALINEVAKYDAQLAAEPRNWVAYAAWLRNRNIVVNGMTLGAAAHAFADADIDPGECANTPFGQSIGGLIAYYTAYLNTLNGGDSLPTYAGPDAGDVQTGFTFEWTAPNLQPPTGQQLSTQTGFDYEELANEVLPQQNYSTEELQQAYDDVDASGGATDTQGYWSGPTKNALDMEINPLGHKNKFQTFLNYTPAQQQMNIGAAASVGRYDKDYLAEFTKATPRGRSSGGIQYG
jgi:hypothetical protein